jgi:hypothetical protein
MVTHDIAPHYIGKVSVTQMRERETAGPRGVNGG